MHQDTLSLVKLLIQAGATPGQDFSCDLHAESCHINENGFQLLQNAYPEIDWGSFAEFVEIDDQQAVDSLHQHLGINFVERILGLIQRQLRQLPSEKASWYLQQVLGGVEQRTGIPLLRYLLEQADLPRRLRVECLLHDEAAATPCSEWMTDLVIAAGGTPDDVTFDGEDAVLTERGLRLLATVWAGEYNLYDVLAQQQS
ncbi:MAG: hypothetical protein WBA57_11725 [Elainellaceae cyanobacterium]